MKTLSAALLATLLMAPTPSFAWDGWRGGRRVVVDRRVVVRHGCCNGAAIAAGVLGGLATGIFLDRVLLPPPTPVYYPEPAYYPPPPLPAPRDPYDAGYSDGYSQGVERGRYERYEQGKRRGYQEGYEGSRAGRGYQEGYEGSQAGRGY